jgi:hypothetical protein
VQGQPTPVLGHRCERRHDECEAASALPVSASKEAALYAGCRARARRVAAAAAATAPARRSSPESAQARRERQPHGHERSRLQILGEKSVARECALLGDLSAVVECVCDSQGQSFWLVGSIGARLRACGGCQAPRSRRPLLTREGTSRNGWQPTADALLTMETRHATGSNRLQWFRLVSALSGPGCFAVDCHRLQPRCSIRLHPRCLTSYLLE